jgi:hypothetical protein
MVCCRRLRPRTSFFKGVGQLGNGRRGQKETIERQSGESAHGRSCHRAQTLEWQADEERQPGDPSPPLPRKGGLRGPGAASQAIDAVRSHSYAALRLPRRANGDLIQIGAIGLIKAIDRFDLDRGVALHTYAATMIIGELKRHFSATKVWFACRGGSRSLTSNSQYTSISSPPTLAACLR